MKPILLSQHLVPVHEFRANLSTWLQHVEDQKSPVVITQHGKAAAVLVSPEMLDELEEEKAMVRLILQGLRDGARGAVLSHEEVKEQVGARFSRSRKP